MFFCTWTQLFFLRSILVLLALASIAGSKMPARADSYEFELTKEQASAPSRKIDIGMLKAQQASRGLPDLISQNSELKWKPPEKSTLVVKTGPDALSVMGKDHGRIYDFKNKRVFDLNTATRTYTVYSLYGDIAFRKAELKNRLFLREMVGHAFKGKGPGQFFDNFFSEEMFAMKLPEKNSGYELVKTKEGNTDVYKYENVIVSKCTPSPAPMSPEKRRQFSRFLIYSSNIHPEIRLDIERTCKQPQILYYFLDNIPVSKERSTLVCKKSSAGDFVATEPEGYQQTIDPRSPLKTVYPRIKELGGKPPADFKQTTLDYYKKSVETKNYLDALLCLTEYGLQTGNNLTEEMAAIREPLKKDSDCQKLIAGLSTPEDERQAMAALSSLDSIDRSKSAKAYLIDIFRANLIINMSDSGVRDIKTSLEPNPAKAFVKVLENNPFIAGVYHDLGKYLEGSYMQPSAWECYDLARKFYPKHPFMEEVTASEQELVKSFPQFFLGDKF